MPQDSMSERTPPDPLPAGSPASKPHIGQPDGGEPRPYTVYSLPAAVRAVIFDIDGTLYKDDAYLSEQGDCQVREFARVRGMQADKARALVAKKRAEYAAAHNGAKTSLAKVLLSLGIPMETSIEWRRTLIQPERFLKPDPELRAALAELAQNYRIMALTNNPSEIGLRNLAALGIEDVFETVVGLEATGMSKPSPEPFLRALQTLALPAEAVVSVGDRYDIDIAPALALGMGGILVDGPAVIPALPKLLA